MGAFDQGARRSAPDAAVAHRQDRRHPGVPATIDRSPTSRSPRSRSGWTTARRKASRATCRRRRSGRTARSGTTRRSSGRGAGHDHPLAPVDAEEGRQRHVVEAGGRGRHHRASMGSRDRGAARHGEGAQDHASCELGPHSGRAGRADAGGAGPVHGVGGRQGRRDHAAEHRQAAAARLDASSGTSTTPPPTRTSPTSSRWASTSTRRVRSRSIGSICFAWGTPGRRRSTFRRTRSRATETFYPLRGGGAHRKLPAAHASARQGDVARGDPAHEGKPSS